MMSAVVVGIVLQVAMVLLGNWAPSVRDFWGPSGMAIAFVAGILAVGRDFPGWGNAVVAGALAGGVGALHGIVLAYMLHDVPASLILLGTVASTVAGILGALAKSALARRTPDGLTKPR
jgi:hypothetical protein